MAEQTQPLKILAIGSPLSDLSTLVSKINAINGKHGPFDACVVVGDLFKEGSDGSEVGGLNFPVPTYFTVGKFAIPEAIQTQITKTGGEVTTNLVYLGKSTVLTTAQGLKIACVGGSFTEEGYDTVGDQFSPVISKDSINTILSHPLLSGAPADPSGSLASAKTSAAALPSAFQGVDLLLFSSPPPHLSTLSPSYANAGITLAKSAPPLEEVVRRAKPRYLLWGDGEGFWEREPWGWAGPNGKEERWTRAVKLGALGSEVPAGGKKARWFYAFGLPPQTTTAPLPARPANATPNPFMMPSTSVSMMAGKKRSALEEQNHFFGEQAAKKGRTEGGPPPESYVCKICAQPGHWIQDCPQKNNRDTKDHSKPPPGYVCKICQSSDHFIRECPNKEDKPRGPKPPPQGYVCRACGLADAHYIRDCPVVLEREEAKSKRKELGPAECWFCLSNPKVTKHLIVAIGSETYVTLPKGQIIPTLPKHIAQGGSKPLVPGGGHVLIIPIAHHPTLLSIPAEDAMSIISELEGFKSSLRACYASYGAVPVTFEVGRLSGRGGHAHVQIVPIPKELAGKVEESFKIAGEKQGIDWEAEPERALARVGPTGNYFKVECPDGTKMIHLLKGNFDLQFGRTVIGSLLGYHHRIDWKECTQSEAEDKEDAIRFKKAFAPFHT
ncbi:nuclear protein [Kwoniella heveanensis BCC8398]|uniref:Nuclear protein n=1 Tax=Kwoniella heveanensis BCC8398 TaxID=1296120 RepID=A0A1B9GLN2_9TREE|nr:nuclear protein [Kwoniella heveanensis BCC8398]